MYVSDELTLIALRDVRNVSQQDVFKIKKLLTTRLTWLSFLFLFGLMSSWSNAQHPFLGKDFVATYQRLQAPWAQEINASAEEICRIVSNAYNVNIWIDMDVPRDRIVFLSKDLPTLADMLDELAIKLDSRTVILDGIVVLAPLSKAERIATQYWTNRTSPSINKWSKPPPAPFEWIAGTDTKVIARDLNKAIKLKDDWIDMVESDIWPARQFQKESLLSSATCILSSMNLELNLSEQFVGIRSLEEGNLSSQQVEWVYTIDQLKRLGDEHCKAWKKDQADVTITTQNQTWLISATPSQHLKLVAPLIPKVKYTKPNPESSVYQGELRGTLGSALEAVSKSLKLEFDPWPLPDAVAKREIKITYSRATLDDILSEIGKAGRLRFQRNGNQCAITILE